MLEQVLALLAAFLIVDVDRQPLQVEIDAVSEQQHQRYGHQHNNDQAARIAQNLNDFLFGHSP